jgi:hypothetical protein
VAIHKRTYQPYHGPRTDERGRALVVFRYALGRVFGSRFAWVCLIVGAVPCGIAGALIYVRNDPTFFAPIRLVIEGFLVIDAEFFSILMGIQSTMAFLMAALTGPGLLAPDLVHGGLPLYLSRPLSRVDYALGKLGVLALVLSFLTWIPGLWLFLLQGLMAGDGWMGENLGIGMAIAVGSWTWILTLSLLVLAISAWVRWRAVAGAMLFGVFFVGTGFATLLNELLDTDWGALFGISGAMTAIWQSLFLETVFEIDYPLPIGAAWASLGAVWLLAALILSLRLRASEVSR